MGHASPSIAAARLFMYSEARLLDRLRFAARFDGGSRVAVLQALRAYQNDDGGFGNALEPDLRGPASQPVPLEHGLQILDEIDSFDERIVGRACDWLTTVTTAEGGVPFVLASVVDGPHAPWWVATGNASLNPTAGIAGLLHKNDVSHPWLDGATTFCWDALDAGVDSLGPDDAVTVLTFLDYVPDRDRAEQVFARLGQRIRTDLVALDPSAEGYVKTPLQFAPRPDRIARSLFDDATVERHLEALAGRQQEDGGWPITWEPPTRAAISEWRGFVTLESLDVLESYGYDKQ